MASSVHVCNPVRDSVSDSVLPKPLDRNLIKALGLPGWTLTNSINCRESKNPDIIDLTSRFAEACDRYASAHHIADEAPPMKSMTKKNTNKLSKLQS